MRAFSWVERFKTKTLPYGLTIDKLYEPHISIPANPLIAESMYLRGTIERMGTGTEEMVKCCIEKGLQKPIFIQEIDFKTILYRPIGGAISKKTMEKTVEKILSLITDNPQITQAGLQKLTGLTRRGIEWNLSKLKSQGLVERIGPDKGGYWKINNE
jgi:predicted HTH transcriptional regulator